MLLFSEKVTSTKKIKIATYLPSVVKVDVSPKRCQCWIRRLCAGKLAERKRNKQGSTHSQCILGGKSLGRESVFAGCIITSPWRSDRRGALHTCELLSSNQGQSTPYPPIGVKQEKFHSNTSSTSFLYAKKHPINGGRTEWKYDYQMEKNRNCDTEYIGCLGFCNGQRIFVDGIVPNWWQARPSDRNGHCS